MALKSEQREIKGVTYEVTQLAAEPGQRLFFSLVKLLGPAVAALLQEWQGKAVTPATIAAAITELAASLEYKHFRDFVDTFQASTDVLGQDSNGRATRVKLSSMKALAFAGDYGGLMQWLGFCLEVNFGSFFSDMGLTNRPGVADEPSASMSPTMSAS